MHELEMMTPEQRVKYLEKMERKREKDLLEANLCGREFP